MSSTPPKQSTTVSTSTSSTSSQSLSSSKKPYGVNLKFKIKQSRRKDFLTLIKDNQRKTLDLEPASLQYIVGEDVSDPNTFYIHEQFVGSDGFDAHRDMDHAADWDTFKNSNPFEGNGGEPTFTFYYGDHAIEKVPIRNAYCVHVELCIKPELRHEFLSVIENNQRGSTQDEPLCLQYVYGEDVSTANKFIFHEEYQGKEGFDAHCSSPHFAKWEEFVNKYSGDSDATDDEDGPFTVPPVVHFFETI